MAPQNLDGNFELEVEAILDVRGLVKKQKGDLGFKHLVARHYVEAREAVIEAIQRLGLALRRARADAIWQSASVCAIGIVC
jgi:hypothetical protein